MLWSQLHPDTAPLTSLVMNDEAEVAAISEKRQAMFEALPYSN